MQKNNGDIIFCNHLLCIHEADIVPGC